MKHLKNIVFSALIFALTAVQPAKAAMTVPIAVPMMLAGMGGLIAGAFLCPPVLSGLPGMWAGTVALDASSQPMPQNIILNEHLAKQVEMGVFTPDEAQAITDDLTFVLQGRQIKFDPSPLFSEKSSAEKIEMLESTYGFSELTISYLASLYGVSLN